MILAHGQHAIELMCAEQTHDEEERNAPQPAQVDQPQHDRDEDDGDDDSLSHERQAYLLMNGG